MVSASLMPPGEASEFPPPFLPSKPTFVHYGELFTRLSLGRALSNSLVVAVRDDAGVLLLNSMAGYAFAKLRFPGRDRLFRVARRRARHSGAGGDAAALPDAALASVWSTPTSAPILPGLAGIIGIFLIRQFARAIPDDLLNAARLEGACEFRIYRHDRPAAACGRCSRRSESSPSWRPGTTSSGRSSS